MIGTCEICDRQNVPVRFVISACAEASQCYLCAGETDPDPYGELEDAKAERLAFHHDHERDYRKHWSE